MLMIQICVSNAVPACERTQGLLRRLPTDVRDNLDRFVSAAECVHDMDNVLLDKLPPGQNALVFAPTACKILLRTACHVHDQ